MPNSEATVGRLHRTGHSANITSYAESVLGSGFYVQALSNDVVRRDGKTVRVTVPEYGFTVFRLDAIGHPVEIGRFSHTPARRPATGRSGHPELPALTVTALVRHWLASHTDSTPED